MYKKSIVLFIDILGFKNWVNQSKTSENIRSKILDILKKFKSLEEADSWPKDLIEIEEDAQKKGIFGFDISTKTKCTCFSDSIVVSIEVEDNLNEIFSTLVANISRIGSKLLCEGILIRGGMDLAEVYHENGVIFGPALIKSYELESATAQYPRIIMSENLISELTYPLQSKSNRYPYHQYIERFEDGCVGFHQLIFYEVIQRAETVTNDELRRDLKSSKDAILEGLDSSIENPKIFSKYEWLMNRYNNLAISEEDLKEEIHDISKAESRGNIHYTYIDSVFNKS